MIASCESMHLCCRLLVWAEQDGDGAAIFCSPFNGGRKQRLYTLPTGSQPVAMAINETTNILYWVDFGLKEIGYVQWNMSQPRRLVLLEEDQYLSDVTLRSGYLYLTDRDGGSVQRIFPGGENPAFEVVFDGLRAPKSAVAVWEDDVFGKCACVLMLRSLLRVRLCCRSQHV